jgi:hypothetical protein
MDASIVGFVATVDVGTGFFGSGEIATGATDEVMGPGLAGPGEIVTGGGDWVGVA